MIEIQLTLPALALEAWSDALLDAGALSVAVEDGDSDTEDEVALYGEPGLTPAAPGWRNNRLSVLVGDGVDPAAMLQAVARELGAAPPAIDRQRQVEDQDWVRLTQEQFAPVAVGRLWIVPSWHEPPEPDARIIRIDPGVAFGTGTHPTTRLCLAWMDRHLQAGWSVLDYGCGSGILSIAAALLGAATVCGVDIDLQAVATARDNAARNGVPAQYTGAEAFAALARPPYDLVVANILANPIILLAPSLLSHVAPGGFVLLSGILARQAAAVRAAFGAAAQEAGAALQLEVVDEDDGWIALAGRRGT